MQDRIKRVERTLDSMSAQCLASMTVLPDAATWRERDCQNLKDACYRAAKFGDRLFGKLAGMLKAGSTSSRLPSAVVGCELLTDAVASQHPFNLCCASVRCQVQ